MDEIDAALGTFTENLDNSIEIIKIFLFYLSASFTYGGGCRGCRFQKCVYCWPLCEGQNQGCTVHHYKV